MLSFIIAAVLMIFLSYYIAAGVHKPMYFGGKGALRNIVKIVSSKTGAYYPTTWSFGGHLHTIFGHILKSSPKVNYLSEFIHTPDGGLLRLDWSQSGYDENYLDRRGTNVEMWNQNGINENSRNMEGTNWGDWDCKKNSEDIWDTHGSVRDSRDIVLILPGATGTSQEKYVLHLVDNAQKLGYRAVVMNNSDTVISARTYRMYCASHTDDLEFVLQHIHRSHSLSRICAVGVSFGGMMLTNYLVKMGTRNKHSLLLAAFTVSVPWDLLIAVRSFIKPVTRYLFNLRITRNIQGIFFANVAALRADAKDAPELEENVYAAAAKAKTLREFDDVITAPMFGYSNVDEYYRASSIAHKSFETVKTPLLCLNAADDPLSLFEQIPVERIRNCENVAMISTHTGDHIGFLEACCPLGQDTWDECIWNTLKQYLKSCNWLNT